MWDGQDRNKHSLVIVRTLQLLYTIDESDNQYDVDYTVFIFSDGTVKWADGKEHDQTYRVGDFTNDIRGFTDLEPFETLPENHTVADLLMWP